MPNVLRELIRDHGARSSSVPLLASAPKYKFSVSDVEIFDLFKEPLYLKIISSDAFQRLRSIRFLGAIDYLVHSNGLPGHRRHTRYDHSIGVAVLALKASNALNLSRNDALHLVVAALVHDLGHAPLSHSLEPVFNWHFGINHHSAGEKILLGGVPIGRSLSKIFHENDIDVERVVSTISGEGDFPGNYLFSNPINIDTIEAISRSYTYASGRGIERAPDLVLQAAIHFGDSGSYPVLDQFWHLKDAVYGNIINGRAGLLVDFLAQHYMSAHIQEFSSETYFQDEPALRRQHPGLFELLQMARHPLSLRQSLGRHNLDKVIEVPVRRFYVEEQAPGGGSSSGRYRQSKARKSVRVDDLIPVTLDDGVNENWLQMELRAFDELDPFEFREVQSAF